MIAETITILNKLSRQDSLTGLDVWYKTELHNLPYSIQQVTDVAGNVTSLGEIFSVLFEFDSAYLPYNQWITTDKSNHYTISRGDIIIIGELLEEVTANNIQQIKNKLKSNNFTVRSIVEVQKRPNIRYRMKVSGN